MLLAHKILRYALSVDLYFLPRIRHTNIMVIKVKQRALMRNFGTVYRIDQNLSAS